MPAQVYNGLNPTMGFVTNGMGTRSAIMPFVADLNPDRWSIINGTGWTTTLESDGSLTIACDASGARDTTSMTASGLIMVYSKPLALDYFDATPAYMLAASARWNEATITGVGFGLGFVDSTTAPTRWGARISRRDGSGTVTKRDESNLQSNSVGTGLSRLDTVCFEHSGMSSSVSQSRMWDTTAGASTIIGTNTQGRTNAFLQMDNGTSTSPVYLALFATTTVASAGSVNVRKVVAHGRPFVIVDTAPHYAGL